MKYIYPAYFYPENDGQISVVLTDFDAFTYGNDLTDAVEMATDLLNVWILEYKKDKKELPQPTAINEIELKHPGGFVSLILADLEEYKTKNSKSVRKNLTIPLWLNDIAEKSNINFSAVLQEALKKELNL